MLLRAALLLVGATFASTTASGAGAAAQPACDPSRAISHSPVALLTVRDRDLVGCLRGGRPRTLVDGSCSLLCSTWAVPRLSGTLAAFAERDIWHCVVSAVRVVDLRTGAQRLSVYAGSQVVDRPDSSCDNLGETVTDLVLRGGGSVSFIAQRDDGVREVVRSDESGTQIVAHGRAIAPRSLTRAGDRVRWRDGDRARSVPLGPRLAPGAPTS
jgi:hypothetical protein